MKKYICELSGKEFTGKDFKQIEKQLINELKKYNITFEQYLNKFFKNCSNTYQNNEEYIEKYYHIDWNKRKFSLRVMRKEYTCHICNKSFTCNAGLFSHVSRIHKLSVLEYSKKCNFDISGDLNEHICGFCNNIAKPILDIDNLNKKCIISYDGYFCGTDECKNNICLSFFNKPYSECGNKFEYIGANVKYLMLKHKTTQEDICNNYKHGEMKPDEKIRASTNLKGYIIRHGIEEGTKKYNERCEKISKSQYIEWYIEKFGKEEGTKKYLNKLKKLQENSGNIGISKYQQKIFDYLNDINPDEWEIEKCLCGGRVDMYNEKYNIIVEYYGDFWHCNPNVYKPGFFNRMLNMTLEEKREFDKKRLNFIQQNTNNSNILIIWESSKILDNVEKMNNVLDFYKHRNNKGLIEWI